MNSTTEELQKLIADFAPNPYVQAILYLLATYLVAKIVVWLIDKILKKAVSRTSNQFDDFIIERLKNPIFSTFLLIGVGIAATRLPLTDELSKGLFSILVTIAIIVWWNFAIAFSKTALKSLSRQPLKVKIVQPHTLPLFENLAVIVIFGLGLYLLLVAWHIDVSAWLASAGILGLALSFAAKDTLANLFAGVFILADAPYKIGDYIVLDSGERGEVTHIGIRSTRILTRDDVEVTIPNSIMGNSKIINETAGPHTKYRIRIDVGAAYGSDVAQVRQVLMNVAESSSSICQIPEPRVRFRALGASSLDFQLLCWVDEPVLRGRVADELYESVYNAFNENGIEIPYAKQDVFIKEFPKNT